MATGGHDSSHGGVPKLGTVVPNRIFVGGISGNTNEEDLRTLFVKFGNVKATKIIIDKAGISKGYGFVTFETEDEAQKVLNEVEGLSLRERKLNIAPAVKKQPYSRAIESTSIHANAIAWPAHSSNFSSRESVYFPQATWPVAYPQQFYLQQQCHYPPPQHAGYPHYVYSVAPPDYPFPSVAQPVAHSDYSETSSADGSEITYQDERESKMVKNNTKVNTISSADYERGRVTPVKTPASASTYRCAGNIETSSFAHHSSPFHIHHPVLAKTVNGVTVMAYPSSLVMGNPTILHVKDGGNGEQDGVLTELGYLHSPMGGGTLTPPLTPLTPISCDYGSNASMDGIRKN